jgi:hypothetical protein
VEGCCGHGNEPSGFMCVYRPGDTLRRTELRAGCLEERNVNKSRRGCQNIFIEIGRRL